jgi:hypothetical protein
VFVHAQVRGLTEYAPPSFFRPSQMAIAEAQKIRQLQGYWSQIINDCQQHKQRLANCESDEECGAASVALQRCTGTVVCPNLVEEFDRCLQAKPVDEDKLEKAFKEVQKALDLFKMDCAAYMPKK